jgi:biotin transport system substrate-specific component
LIQAVTHRPVVLVDRLLPAGISRSLAGSIVLVALGALVVALASQVRIPLGFTPVPISGGTFGVIVVGASLGAVRGGLALALYLLIGLVGMPVFTGGNSGVSYFLGATGGYLVGFVVAAALLGYLAERRVDRHVRTALPGIVLSSIVIYVFGVTGLMLAVGADLPRALELGVVPFLFGDAVKIGLAATLLPAAWALVGRIDTRSRS